jgi:hypothetical protein
VNFKGKRKKEKPFVSFLKKKGNSWIKKLKGNIFLLIFKIQSYVSLNFPDFFLYSKNG